MWGVHSFKKVTQAKIHRQKKSCDRPPLEICLEDKMKFWKDKDGKKLTFKEFMVRWKLGIEGITPLQQVKGQLNSTYIMLIGIACGFVISLFGFKNLWWLSIILGAAFFNTLISALGLFQKKIAFDRLNELIKGGENDIL